MAGRAVIGDADGGLGVMAPIVTSEATWVIVVAEIVGMRSPGNFHEGKNIPAIAGGERLGGLFDLGLLSIPNGRILGTV
jgi:hypothetical protein